MIALSSPAPRLKRIIIFALDATEVVYGSPRPYRFRVPNLRLKNCTRTEDSRSISLPPGPGSPLVMIRYPRCLNRRSRCTREIGVTPSPEILVKARDSDPGPCYGCNRCIWDKNCRPVAPFPHPSPYRSSYSSVRWPVTTME